MKKKLLVISISLVVVACLIFVLISWVQKQYGYNQVCEAIQSERQWAKEGTDYKVEFLFSRDSTELAEDGEPYEREYYYRATIFDAEIDIRYYRVLWIVYKWDKTQVQVLGANDRSQRFACWKSIIN